MLVYDQRLTHFEVNIKDQGGLTPLSLAIQDTNHDAIKILHNQGA